MSTDQIEASTAAEEIDDNPTPDPTRGTRGVSQIQFPYVDLDSALAVAKTILDAGGVPIARDQLAVRLGQQINSGSFNQKLNAARLFGLIEANQNRYQLTQLGHAALSRDPARQRASRMQAFLLIPLYRKTYDTFRGNHLPPRPLGLEQAFVEFGVAPKQKDKARQVFERSARQAGFFEGGPDQLVEPIIGQASEPPRQESGRRETSPPAEQKARVDDQRHPLIEGLFATIPPVGTDWPWPDQVKWLEAAASIFPLIYKNKGGKLTVTLTPDRKDGGE